MRRERERERERERGERDRERERERHPVSYELIPLMELLSEPHWGLIAEAP